MDWNPQVHQRSARKDGLGPEDFQFDQWPVSNVTLRLPVEGESSRIALCYECDIPADTPQANRYVEDKSDPTGWKAMPDPVGMALSSVRFELRDESDEEVLDKDSRDHADGKVLGFLTEGDRILWERLTPGSHLRVRLYATPMFYYLAEDGSMKGQYADGGHRGYFAGKEVRSEAYALAMTEDGALLLNG